MSNINVVDNYVSSSNILCLDIDCLEELFEWLPLPDLRTLRASCKRMKLAVDYYIQNTYPNGFGTLIVCESEPDELRNLDASFCKLYKRLQFGSKCPWSISLCDDIIERLKTILNHVEQIVIDSVDLESDFYSNFLQHCTKLKYLQIESFDEFSASIGFNWLLRDCPTLEHLVLIDHYDDDEYAAETPQLRVFLEQNPNIRRLTLDPRFIPTNFTWMKESNIKLDQLDIVMYCENWLLPVMFCNGLEVLYELGFYKKLNLYVFGRYEQEDLYEFQTLFALNELDLGSKRRNIMWPTMPQLKEFSIDSDYRIEIDEFIENFANIEKVHMEKACFDSILPLIQRVSTLKEISIHSPQSGTFVKDGIIDLPALNKERRKCTNASKIAICVKEDIYLETKRAFSKVDFSLIELKRAELHKFLNSFNTVFWT